jgi:hypothetical protein
MNKYENAGVGCLQKHTLNPTVITLLLGRELG